MASTLKMTCPLCKKTITLTSPENPYRPFCSKRCADVDLGKWLHESYRIPSVSDDKEEE